MVRLKVDGADARVSEGAALTDVAPSDALVVRLNGELVDLDRCVSSADEGSIVETASESESLQVLRHSSAHVMAQAVLRLFPGAKYAIGPPIENGFYYDFDLPRPLVEEDLEKIESEMDKILADDQPFSREEVSRDEAILQFADQPYKLEILQGTDERGEVKVGDIATLYKNGDAFIDLCLGPHVESTGRIKHIKLLRFSGAYWRGDETRPQLQRIYGTAWLSREELDEYLHRLQEAARRDHRKLGRELDLFSSPPEVGSGIFVWHPKGGLLRKILEDYSRDVHLANGYDIVASPHIGREALFKTSGHLEKFADSMFPPISADEGDYYLKPMNCPHHALIYRSRTRSYRELPLRFSELGTVYRHERSGTLHGLLRVRSMTQDDAHIFCRPDQVFDEIRRVMEMTVSFYQSFGFTDPVVHLSTRNPDTAIGTPEMWDKAEGIWRQVLDASPYDYEIAAGEGAFYGPKADFHFRDAIGRLWQLTTIQLDFALPDRFGLEYIGEDNEPHRPVMIHRVLYGSVERFVGVLLEHTAGHLPPWLSPVQVRLIPIKGTDDAVHELASSFVAAGLRTDVDDSHESMSYKIRRGTLERIPWMCIAGPGEIESGTVSVRTRSGQDHRGVPVDSFIADAAATVASKRGALV